MATRPRKTTTKAPVETGTHSMAMRVEKELLARIDEATRKESKPGLVLSRTDMIRVLVEEGLERRGFGKVAA